ncbi:hypothetical protein BTVI_139722 [Pitangus sulphuratus]|nr:hypothetical protein BTVI_139722 [Pitangus sulphuratus]
MKTSPMSGHTAQDLPVTGSVSLTLRCDRGSPANKVVWMMKNLGEVHKDQRKANVTPTFKKKDPGNYMPVRVNFIPRKVMEQLTLEAIFKHRRDKNHKEKSAWTHQAEVMLDKLDNLL